MPHPTAGSALWRRLLAAGAMAALLAAGCSEETQKEVDEAADSVREDAEDAAGDAGARTVAESLRAALAINDIAENDGYRSVKALQDAADDLPGDPQISGIEDADGDGFDDDGEVEVTVEDQAACLLIPETGTETEVTNGGC